MTALPPYSGDDNPPCPKCGEEEASTRHLQNFGTLLPDGVLHRAGGPEVMLRSCRRCDYAWVEAPLDSE